MQASLVTFPHKPIPTIEPLENEENIKKIDTGSVIPWVGLFTVLQ